MVYKSVTLSESPDYNKKIRITFHKVKQFLCSVKAQRDTQLSECSCIKWSQYEKKKKKGERDNPNWKEEGKKIKKEKKRGGNLNKREISETHL